MQTPVLATKLFAPTRRSELVARSRLVEQLDATLHANNRLTLVSAPAGFGKTSLVGDWLTHLESQPSEIGVGWLSLDEDDNDLSRLLTHVAAALRDAGLPVDPARLESHQGVSPSFVLTSIVNEVTQTIEELPARHWVLVLDDYHAISAAEVHNALSFLLDHLPRRLHLLIATRSDPALPLSRLRSRGELTEIRAADLRFTPSEASEFLNRAMGLDLSEADSLALEERTEGWIAGLQLAALSLRGVDDQAQVAGFIEAFTGSNRFVIDYLVDEVLSRQPGEVREFLLRTAVLDQLSGSLCDAVTTRQDSRRLLEELDRANLFLVPLDDQRVWYRYHHLFADVLRARLLSEQPDEVRELHGRASAWYAAHDEPIRAVRHALAAEDFPRAGRLMEESLTAMRRARQDSTLLTWMQSLPEWVVHRSPVLSIWSAWSRLMAGDLDAIEPQLQAAEAALAAGAEDPELAGEWADTEDLRTAPAAISIYRASLAQARGDVAGTVRHAQKAWDLAGHEDHFIRGQAGAFLGLAAWADGNVAQALDTFGTAVRSLQAAGNLVDALDATVVLADMWIALGKPARARELYERGLHRATRDGEPYPRATADLHVGLAELDRELDDLPSAEEHLETARVLAQGSSISENRHRWHVVMAHVRAGKGDYVAALQLLDEAEGLYRHGFYPDIRPIPAMRARLQISAGDLEAAAGWAHDRGLSVEDDPAYLREFEHLTLVRLLIAEHRAGRRSAMAGSAEPLEAALDLLDRLYDAAAAAGRDGSMEEIRTLQAEARDGAHALPRQALADPLSQRELDVLRLLDSELTGPEVARRLYVSLNTMRTHTKRIFTKLDVNTRAAAVRRARELGLL